MDKNFINLWDLKNLPLTELMGNYDPSIQNFDQSLIMSSQTGHVQLANKLPSEILYEESDYSYRTGTVFKSNKKIQGFVDFFNKSTSQDNFNCIIDVGGNDLTLAKYLRNKTKRCFVIDPLCALMDGETIDGIRVIGKIVEKVDLRELKPEVVVCRHTLEHIENTKIFFEQLFDQCPSDCIYVFEVPDFDCLIESLRFDAILHQHLHYFSLSTLTNLIIECGGEVTDHFYNYQGPCGGSLFVSFKKSNKKNLDLVNINIEDKKNLIKEKIEYFKIHMDLLIRQIENLPQPIFGYGAGLMLATYAYHLKTDFTFLESILDDDPSKHGKGYKNIPVEINHPSKIEILPNSSFIITSLENIRPIYNKLKDFNPRRIVTPLIT